MFFIIYEDLITMSKQKLHSVLEALMTGDTETATKFLRETLDDKGNAKLTEDHEKSMTSAELAKYLKSLHGKVKDEHKEKALKHIASDSGVECDGKSFDACAAALSKDKKKADALIHKLEKLTGSAIDPKEYKKDKEEGETDAEAEKEAKK